MSLKKQILNNGKMSFKLAWIRAEKLNAIPTWSRYPNNLRKIFNLYVIAQIKNVKTRDKYHIDHIIPLVHDKICGLHVFENLRIITKQENIEKSNTFVPYIENATGRVYVH